jgi:hypothetical protein
MALHDDVCWADLNGKVIAGERPVDADECRMMRERSVAGKSDKIPPCAKHDKRKT